MSRFSSTPGEMQWTLPDRHVTVVAWRIEAHWERGERHPVPAIAVQPLWSRENGTDYPVLLNGIKYSVDRHDEPDLMKENPKAH